MIDQSEIFMRCLESTFEKLRHLCIKCPFNGIESLSLAFSDKRQTSGKEKFYAIKQ